MNKVALCVGVDYYAKANCLEECIADAQDIEKALSHNGDHSVNFETITRFAQDKESALTRQELKTLVERLFSLEVDTALFYFSGHGAVDDYGGYLCTSDVEAVDDGLSMDTLMKIVAKSKARNRIILLDCCHSGTLAEISMMEGFCKLPPNTTIMSACTNDDVAYEGVFTPLVVDALNGGAMNLLGEVTPASVYSYVDRALGAFFQRPVFKANVKNYVCLRKNTPPISLDKLHMLPALFKEADMDYPLDPSYEEDKNYTEDKQVDKAHEYIFRILRDFASVNLVVPVGEEYMYWAAIHSKSCRLTALGRYYWQLVVSGRI